MSRSASPLGLLALRATRSISPGGSPRTLPSSRIALRPRNVGKAATSAARSLSVAFVHAWDQELADIAWEVEVDVRESSQTLVLEAPSSSLLEIGSMCERPVR